jgi:uncharacterized oligopeptide transporter (OPT) family protein
MAGSLVTQYKIAYWLGATPRRVELANLLGAIVASAATTAVILLMARVYGFTPGPAHPHALPAPQPNVMADVLRGAMGSGGVPWSLYAIGAACAVGAQLAGLSGLAFALGMYLPMELNSPLLLGALVAWAIQRSARGVAPLAAARHDQGTLIASGFIAGGALVGVLIALMRYAQELTGRTLIVELNTLPGIGSFLTAWGNWLGLAAFLLLALWVFYAAWRERGETPAP